MADPTKDQNAQQPQWYDYLKGPAWPGSPAYTAIFGENGPAGKNASGVSEFFGGKAGGFQQLNPYNPQQQAILNQLGQLGLAGVQRIQADPFAGLGKGVPFAPIANKARYEFATQTVPQLAERFAGADALRSSGFRGALGSAGAGLDYNLAALGAQHALQERGLDQQLAALRANYQSQQQSQLQNLLNLGLQPNYQFANQQAQPGFGQAAGGSIAQFLIGLALKAASGGIL